MAILAPFLAQSLGDIWKQQSIKVVPIVVSIPQPSHIQTMPPTSMWFGECAVEIRKFFFTFIVLTNGVAISSLTFLVPVHKPPESESLLLWITMGALRSSLWSIRTLHSYLLYVAAIPNIYSFSSGNNFFGTMFALSSSQAYITPDVWLSQIPGPGWSWSLTRGGSSPGSTLAVTIQSSEERWTKERWEKGQNDRLCWSFFFSNECVEYLHSGFQEFSTRPISTRTNGKGDKCF